MQTSRVVVVVSVGHRSAVAHDCIGVPVHPRGRRWRAFCSPWRPPVVSADGRPSGLREGEGSILAAVSALG